MKIDIPEYNEYGSIYYDNRTIERFANENNYLKTIDEFKISLEILEYTKIEQYVNLKNEIQNKIDNNSDKLISFIKEDYEKNISYKKSGVFNNMPEHIVIFWKEKLQPLIDIHKSNAEKSNKFIKDNANAIFEVIDSYIIISQNKLKESRKKANQKYYLKKKELLNTIPAVKKTTEQLKESRKLVNQKYYLKNKVNNILDEPTQNEYKLKKKEYNKNYYLKKKEIFDKYKYLIENTSNE